MPKSIPNCPPIPENCRHNKETREFEIQLVTPMFGGGVVAGEIDPICPIRGTSIRGQLRTWWRIIYGYSLGRGMWQREEEIFGTTKFPSSLTVMVLDQPTLRLDEADFGDSFGPIAYALFAAVENKQRVAKEGCKFCLRVSWDTPERLGHLRFAQNEQQRKEGMGLLPPVIADISAEIEGALRAWLSFGGIGARTRRGCGTIFCEMATQASLPFIPGRILLGLPQTNSLEAWKKSVAVYQEFRQTPRGKKHSKTIHTRNGPKTIQVPGRSHWPEADSIRHITGCSLKSQSERPIGDVLADEDPHDHSTPVVPRELLPAFPKGVLGLPINFHFADGPGKNAPGSAIKDPQDTQLVAVAPCHTGKFERFDRMSSPILTRPLWVDGKWHPAVIILNHAWPEGLTFRLEGKKAKAGGEDISHDIPLNRIASPSLGVLRPMRGQPSAIEALVNFLSLPANGFKEVIR
jgi:CRISPR-associated protein Cmr1